MSLSPRDFLAGRLLMLAFLLVFLRRDLGNILFTSIGPKELVISLLLIAGICAFYAWFWLGLAGGTRTRATAIALLGLLACVTAFTLLDPARSYPFYYPFYYCAIVAGAAFSWRYGLLAVAAVVAFAAALVLFIGGRGSVVQDLAVVMSLLGLSAVAVRRHVANFVQLRLAREEIRRLAVAEERLRLSRDLHDQLGQSLTTVVLQSEALGLGLAASDSEAKRRAATVAETARAALDSMRDVAAGYRQPDLAAELMEADRMLEACGIRCHVSGAEHAAGDKGSTSAWALREAVTNVLRHSGAHNCWIELASTGDELELSISDDGRGARDTTGGNGLSGLRARVEAVGGRVTTDSAPGRGFRLQVRLLAEQ